MTFVLDILVNCDSQWKSVIAGAATSVLGIDRALVRFGAPVGVHWALAGVGVDAYCKGRVMTSAEQMAWMAAGGFVGGLALTSIRRSGPSFMRPFLGPLLEF